jgi:hypothetical protein
VASLFINLLYTVKEFILYLIFVFSPQANQLLPEQKLFYRSTSGFPLQVKYQQPAGKIS